MSSSLKKSHHGKAIQKCPFRLFHQTPLEIPQPLNPEALPEKTGVIIVNLGTPDDTSFGAVRRYLKEFLSDRRVIGACPFLWQLLLNAVILTVRPSKTAAVYKSVWREETDESPIRYYTRQQAELLKKRFKDHKSIVVDFAMRYGNPSLEKVITNLQHQGCTKLVVLPLYPQYAASTTATVCDQVFRVLMRMRWQPTLRIAPPYEAHDLYIKALKSSIQTHLKTLDWTPDKIMVSFHGIPLEYVERGDPYKTACIKTFETLKKSLKTDPAFKDCPPLTLTFQSRFGPKEWLQPYTDKTLEQEAKDGTKKIALMAPGFAADCIETLEELQLEGAEIFYEHGGTHFTQIPCMNDDTPAIDLYESLIKDALKGF